MMGSNIDILCDHFKHEVRQRLASCFEVRRVSAYRAPEVEAIMFRVVVAWRGEPQEVYATYGVSRADVELGYVKEALKYAASECVRRIMLF